MNATQSYLKLKGNIENELHIYQQKAVKLPYLRLAILIALFLLVYFLFPYGWLPISMSSTALVVLFFAVVKYDIENAKKIKFTKEKWNECVFEINSFSLKFENNSVDYFDVKTHRYAPDLDILGSFSLFSFINRTTIKQSSQLLQKRLLDNHSVTQAKSWLAQCAELANKLDWRINLRAIGKLSLNKIDENKIDKWLENSTENLKNSVFIVAKVLPIITSIAIVLSFYVDFNKVVTLLIILHILIVFATSKKTIKIYEDANGVVPLLKQYAGIAEIIESEKFENKELKNLTSVFHPNNSKASVELKKLTKIINSLELKNNVYFWIPLNILFFWDINYTAQLQKWKAKNATHIKKWMEAICELEVLNSIAAIHYNYEHWAKPELVDTDSFLLEAQNCGHPLLNENKCVKNSITISKKPYVMILTGSNMSGKSTFLRTIGTNIVLAKIGSVVCASHFKMNDFDLHTSMRIADDLSNDTSTFYAELKRLKSIVEQLNTQQNTLVLLDEILRGTNSIDRHKGSEALIKQIIKQNGVSIVATHDIVLSTLENEYNSTIQNAHFDVSVDGEELFFDYKLKEGVCKSMNASILMKKMGIEV